jgi:hypothetical protein
VPVYDLPAIDIDNQLRIRIARQFPACFAPLDIGGDGWRNVSSEPMVSFITP